MGRRIRSLILIDLRSFILLRQTSHGLAHVLTGAQARRLITLFNQTARVVFLANGYFRTIDPILAIKDVGAIHSFNFG